ncbi:phasin family protein [Benzoatithermus flavus]|uniref:Phasin family protein n=1 Tax=Benzoatithermus flavus TaxID=3108223 RepID=A0ABU8XVY0_9PROT
MAQIANRDAERNEANRATDAAKEAADRTANLAKEATSRTTDVARDAAERIGDAGRRMLAGSSEAADTALRIESDLARLWLELTNQQLRHNAETLQRLVAVRDWREAIEIQSAFVQETLSRLADGLSRQLDLTGSLATRLLEVGRGQANRTI